MPATVNKKLALIVIAFSQLMVVLDATIVNVALSDIRKALEFTSDADLSWVVTGYTLTYGGFLLLGGKLADRLGRRRVFLGGATAFAVASALGGFAQNQEMLIGSRLLQGLGAAMMSPAALSLLTVIFEEGPERNRALGIFSTLTAAGAALGLIIGGLLTTYLSWRWVFFVNLPFAIVAVIGGLRFVPESKDENAQGFDLLGAFLATGGLIALVYGLVKANDPTVSDATNYGTFALAAVLLLGFVAWQRRAPFPLVPVRVFRTRSVAWADAGSLLVGTGIFALFFFLVLWMTEVNGWSPIRAGVSFLVMPVFIGAGAAFSAKNLSRFGPRPLLCTGMALASTGMLLLGLRLEPDSSYATVVVPSLVLIAIGMGLSFVSATSAAIAGVPHEDAGIASAMLNAAQQVGGALGLAILTAVSTRVINDDLPRPSPGDDPAAFQAKVFDAVVNGWSAGFVVAACILAAAGLVFSRIKVSKELAAEALKEAVPA